MRKIKPFRWAVSLLFLAIFVAGPIINQEIRGTDLLVGSTWSITVLGYKFSNPLAVLETTLASNVLHPEILLSAIVPLILIGLFGRFFCGWICPAGIIFELNSRLKHRLDTPDHRFSKSHKYGILVFVVLFAAFLGSTFIGVFHPPHILGRELFLIVEYGFFGAGALLFVAMVGAELTISERAVCRYFCPSGALMSLLGNFRRIRVRMKRSLCDRCGDCDEICMFDLKPMAILGKQDVSPECNNCGDCIDICHSDALYYHFEKNKLK